MRKVSSAMNIRVDYSTNKPTRDSANVFYRPPSSLSSSTLMVKKTETSKKKQKHLSRSTTISSTSYYAQGSKEILYDDALSLKQEVNKLKQQISMMKSLLRKKDTELLKKEKMIENGVDTVQTPNDYEKLVQRNTRYKLKKDFNNLKKDIDNQREINDNLKQKIKTIKPKDMQLRNDQLEIKLKEQLMTYTESIYDNELLSDEMKEVVTIAKDMSARHQMIDILNSDMEKSKQRIMILKRTIKNFKDEKSLYDNDVKKARVDRLKLKKKLNELIKTKDLQETYEKNKPLHDDKIASLEQQVNHYKEVSQQNENKIQELSNANKYLINQKKSHNENKIKQINYRHFEVFETDPNECDNAKLLLVRSMINESNQKQRRYKAKINSFIEKLNGNGIKTESFDHLINDLNIKHKEKSSVEQTVIPLTKPVTLPSTDEQMLTDFKGSGYQLSALSAFTVSKNDYMSSMNNLESMGQLTNDDFREFAYVIIKNFESRGINTHQTQAKVMKNINKTSPSMTKELFINEVTKNIVSSLDCDYPEVIKKINKWLESIFVIYNQDLAIVAEEFITVFSNIREYDAENDIILSKKIKKALIPFKEKLKKKFPINQDNGIISYRLLKGFLEEEQINIKDYLGEFLFYKLKQFKGNEGLSSLYDLDMKILYNIFDNTLNDSKMNLPTEMFEDNEDNDSKVEISPEDYNNIIQSFIRRLNDYLVQSKKTLKETLVNGIKNLKSSNKDEGFDVIELEVFVEELKKIGIDVSKELEVYTLYNRYKISDEFDFLSIDIIQNDLVVLKTAQNYQSDSSKKPMEKVLEEDDESNDKKPSINH